MMVYFLNYCLKTSLFLSFILFCNYSYAEINFKLSENDSEKKIIFDYELNYTIHKELEKIINKGIAIEILEEVNVTKRKSFFFNKKIYKIINPIKIEFHPLIKKYYFFDKEGKKSFLSLFDVMNELNKSRNVSVDEANLKKNRYDLEILWSVNLEKLPKSFQLKISQPEWLILDKFQYTL
jgi:hypothetical protein